MRYSAGLLMRDVPEVRSTPNSGHSAGCIKCPLSAKADMEVTTASFRRQSAFCDCTRDCNAVDRTDRAGWPGSVPPVICASNPTVEAACYSLICLRSCLKGPFFATFGWAGLLVPGSISKPSSKSTSVEAN